MANEKNDKDGWTTMYVPKGDVQRMIVELTKLLEAEIPYDLKIPKYRVLELALRESIEARTKTRTKKK
jgi:hypothetical protein